MHQNQTELVPGSATDRGVNVKSVKSAVSDRQGKRSRQNNRQVKDIVYVLRQQWARHGVPEELYTDNSPFLSAEFKEHADMWGFQAHYVVTDLQPSKRLRRSRRAPRADIDDESCGGWGRPVSRSTGPA